MQSMCKILIFEPKLNINVGMKQLLLMIVFATGHLLSIQSTLTCNSSTLNSVLCTSTRAIKVNYWFLHPKILTEKLGYLDYLSQAYMSTHM